MQFKYVTGMNREQYDNFGSDMIESFCDYWPKGELHIYTENEPFPFEHPRVKYQDLLNVGGCAQFLYATSMFPAMSGELGDRNVYTHNIHKFCRKAFAQIDAACDFDGYLFWIDSDVETIAPIPAIMLEEMMRGNFISVMKRKTWHLCASFIGWDCGHAFASGWWQHYLEMYTSGAVFTLPQWDDCTILESIIQGMPGVNDIAAHITGEGPYNVFNDVFEGFAHHDKGIKKHANRYGHLIELVKNLQPKHIVEIGTWNGERALQMLQASPDAHYIGFDLFEEGTEETDKIEKNVKQHFTMQDVGERLSAHSAELFRGDTKQTFTAFADVNQKWADLIFIDGGHSVETIRSDYENAKKVIKPGGFIVLDDYYTEMPDSELQRYGAQAVLGSEEYALLPTRDWVKGGGRVQMAVVQC